MVNPETAPPRSAISIPRDGESLSAAAERMLVRTEIHMPTMPATAEHAEPKRNATPVCQA